MQAVMDMTLEECIQKVLACDKWRVSVSPSQGNIRELLQYSLNLLGISCEVTAYDHFSGTHTVFLYHNMYK